MAFLPHLVKTTSDCGPISTALSLIQRATTIIPISAHSALGTCQIYINRENRVYVCERERWKQARGRSMRARPPSPRHWSRRPPFFLSVSFPSIISTCMLFTYAALTHLLRSAGIGRESAKCCPSRPSSRWCWGKTAACCPKRRAPVFPAAQWWLPHRIRPSRRSSTRTRGAACRCCRSAPAANCWCGPCGRCRPLCSPFDESPFDRSQDQPTLRLGNVFFSWFHCSKALTLRERVFTARCPCIDWGGRRCKASARALPLRRFKAANRRARPARPISQPTRQTARSPLQPAPHHALYIIHAQYDTKFGSEMLMENGSRSKDQKSNWSLR